MEGKIDLGWIWVSTIEKQRKKKLWFFVPLLIFYLTKDFQILYLFIYFYHNHKAPILNKVIRFGTICSNLVYSSFKNWIFRSSQVILDCNNKLLSNLVKMPLATGCDSPSNFIEVHDCLSFCYLHIFSYNMPYKKIHSTDISKIKKSKSQKVNY